MSEENIRKKLPKIVTQVDDLGRKKFALKEDSISDHQQQQQQKFIDTGRFTSTLIGRQLKIDTNKYIGKIQGTKKKKKTEVFYCQVCKVGFKCDLAYISHVNSPAHNRKLGMNMKVEAVSIETVSQKLAKLAEQKNKSKQQKILEKKLGKNWQKQINKQEKQSEQQNLNILKKQNADQIKIQDKKKDEVGQKQEKGEDQVQQEEDADQIMMRSLGLPTTFGSKKKKY